MTHPEPDSHFSMEFPVGSSASGSVSGQPFRLNGCDAEITLEGVDAVTVSDLQWVEQHTITRVFNSVSHFIRFVGGGELRFAFSFEGDLLELSGVGVKMSSAPDSGTLVFSPLQSRSGQGSAKT